MVKYTLVMPAYNEEKRIGKTLTEYCLYFSSYYKKEIEILVVLNGCKDNTLGVVQQFVKKYSFVRFLNISDAIGKGGAVLEGFKHAKGKFVGFVDADNATPVHSFVYLMEHFSGDGVIASRRVSGSKVFPQQSFVRRCVSRFFNVMVRTLLFLPFKDTQCGAKLFTREAALFVVDKLHTTRWAFDVDLLFVLQRNGFIIKELPTEWHDVAGSQLRVGKVSLQMFFALIRLRLIYSPFDFLVDWYNTLASFFHKK